MLYVLLTILILILDTSHQQDSNEEFIKAIDKLKEVTEKKTGHHKKIDGPDISKRKNSRIIYVTAPATERNADPSKLTINLEESEEKLLDNIYNTDFHKYIKNYQGVEDNTNNTFFENATELVESITETNETITDENGDHLTEDTDQEIKTKSYKHKNVHPHLVHRHSTNTEQEQYPELIIHKITNIDDKQDSPTNSEEELMKKDLIIDELIRKILQLKIRAHKEHDHEDKSLQTELERSVGRRSPPSEDFSDEHLIPTCTTCNTNLNTGIVNIPTQYYARSMLPIQMAYPNSQIAPPRTDNAFLTYGIAQRQQRNLLNNVFNRAMNTYIYRPKYIPYNLY